MNSLTTARTMLVLRRAQVDEAKLDVIKAVGNSFITCRHCGKRSQVKNIVLIQTHWYTRPWGCNGGDYWNVGEKQFGCPKCKRRNRDYNNPRFKDFAKYREAFASQIDEHKR